MTTSPFRPLPAGPPDLPSLETQVLARWHETSVFDRSMAQTARGSGLGLLRGPADGERQAGRPPRRGPRLQGPVPALQDDEGLPRPAPGGLGLPRPAGRARHREGARLQRQAGHRGLRGRRVQREVPRVGAAPRGRVRAAHRADGLLDRPGRRLPDDGHQLHRVRLVEPEDDLGQGPAGAGQPGRAVLPALPDRPLRPRGRDGLHRRRRPERLRALPGRRQALRPAGLDDDAVDAGLQHRRRRPSRGRPTR